LLTGCSDPTCGNAHCSSFENFGGPADKEVYSCIRTGEITKVTTYVLRDDGQTLIDCEDGENEDGCRLMYYSAREAACASNPPPGSNTRACTSVTPTCPNGDTYGFECTGGEEPSSDHSCTSVEITPPSTVVWCCRPASGSNYDAGTPTGTCQMIGLGDCASGYTSRFECPAFVDPDPQYDCTSVLHNPGPNTLEWCCTGP
jgi:hypothetical protein